MKFFWNTHSSCLITGQAIVSRGLQLTHSYFLILSFHLRCVEQTLLHDFFSNALFKPFLKLLASTVHMWPVLVPDGFFLHRDTVCCKILATLAAAVWCFTCPGCLLREKIEPFPLSSSCKWIYTPSKRTWTFQNHQLKKINVGVYGWFIVIHRHSSLRRSSIMYDISHLVLIWTTAARLH